MAISGGTWTPRLSLSWKGREVVEVQPFKSIGAAEVNGQRGTDHTHLYPKRVKGITDWQRSGEGMEFCDLV